MIKKITILCILLSCKICQAQIKNVRNDIGTTNSNFSSIDENLFQQRPTAITLSISVTGATCVRRNGNITVTASGGAAPYKYYLDAGDARDNGNFFFLPPNDFIIKVVDATGQAVVQNVTIPNTFERPVAFGDRIYNPSSCTASDGSIKITGYGGTPPYLYSSDRMNFQSSDTIAGLYSGIYPYFVQDANGCVSEFAVYVSLVGSCNIQWNAQGGAGTGYGSYGSCNPLGWETTLAASGVGGPFYFSLDGVNFSPNTNGLYFFEVDTTYTIWIRNSIGDTIHYLYKPARLCDPTILIRTSTQPAFCGQNGSITVVAEDGTAPYQYSLDGLSFLASNKFNGLVPGKYVATVKDANGYESSSIVNVGNKCVNITAVADSSTCSKSNGRIRVRAFNGVVPYQYSIDGLNYQTDSVFTTVTAGKYVVYVKDAAASNISDTVLVADKGSPKIDAALATPTDCDNQSGSITIVATGGALPLLFANNGSLFQPVAAFNNLAKGDYIISVKDSNGCVNTALATVSLNNTLTIDAGKDTVTCEGKNIILTAQSNGSQFSWLPVTGLGNPASSTTSAKPLVNTTYFVTASKGICSKTDSVNITVKPAPVAIATQNSTICFGKDAAMQGSGGIEYSWSPPDYLDNATIANPKVIKPLTSTIYTLKVVGSNGCQSINDPSVNITVTPPPKLFAGNDTLVAIGQSLQLLAADLNNSGFSQYKWQPFTGLNNPTLSNPVANLTSDIMYVVSASTTAGCTGKDSMKVRVFKQPEIYVAGAFAPGGVNRYLHAIPVGIKTFQYFIIYDRWGKKVFHTTNASKGWDGQSQNSGGFVWIAAGIDFTGAAIKRKGSVVLLR